MAVYKLVFDWYNEEMEDVPWFEQEERVFYFTDAEKALNHVKSVVWNEAAYTASGSPLNAYLYRFDEGAEYNEPDMRYIAAWFDLDEKIRF